MIAKRVERKKGSQYANLVSYLLRESGQTASNKEDSVEYTKITNCNLDEVNLAVKEIEATQALNTRSKIDCTYHLIVSFQNTEKPKPEQLEDIENEICRAIGLEDHQRISVAHKDTDNFHVHLAINKIHPESYRAVEPYYDKYKLDTACAELEQKHGLKRDNRIDREQHRDKLETGRQSGRAGNLETHQGKVSFKQWLAERKDAVTAELSKAESWHEIHTAMAKHGLSLRTRGAGLVIANQEGNVSIKASDLGRDFSKAKLEGRLGEYRPPDDRTLVIPAHKGYQEPSRPQSQSRKPDPLWERYQKDKEQLRARRTELLKELGEKRKAELKQQKLTYGKVKLEVFFNSSLDRKQKDKIAHNLAITRLTMSRESYARHRESRARIINETTPKRWPEFLRELAQSEDSKALQKLKQLETQQRRQQHGREAAAAKDRDQGR